MIIDKILDRKDGLEYKPKTFYDDIMGYYEVFPEIVEPIGNALDKGTEQDVKKALNLYIIEQEYNPEICIFINSVNWI